MLEQPPPAVYTKDLQFVLDAETQHLGAKPRHGLALSGGGIRSASFAAGVMQALVLGNILKSIDYISTVSGGGYIGSSLTWWLKQGLPNGEPAGTEPHNFPFGARDQGPNTTAQNAILDYVRFHGNYLSPSRQLNAMSLAAGVIRIATVSLTVYFSCITLVMLILSYLVFIASYLVGLFPFANPNDYNGNLFHSFTTIPVVIIVCFFILSLLYSIYTLIYQLLQFSRSDRPWPSRRYKGRARWQGYFGRILFSAVAFALLGLLSAIDYGSDNFRHGRWLTVPIILTSGLVILLWRGRTEPAETVVSTTGTRQLVGCSIILYSLVMISFIASQYLYKMANAGPSVKLFCFLAGLLFVALVLGSLVNVNYLGIHRMYRDRLMELFLPNKESVTSNTWGLATDADGMTIETMCQPPHMRPYHLINTNIVLVDSSKSKYKGRGGDNFIVSPLFCGSEATGWCCSKAFMKKNDPGMTLATAMAISGAAANPNTGVAGAGFARNRLVATLMSLLNLRLGHWTPHPDPQKSWPLPPNFIFPGITSGVLVGRLSENSRVVDLTDGGHFDNLGLYELIRRRLPVIIVCDGSADPSAQCIDLAIAIERVKIDFRTDVRFENEEFDLSRLRPGSAENVHPFDKRPLAKCGFAVGTITYEDHTKGTLLYIKATLTPGLTHDIYGYQNLHPAYPHETTTDQNFDETQFEAYRELGYHLAWQLLEANDRRRDHPDGKWLPCPDLPLRP